MRYHIWSQEIRFENATDKEINKNNSRLVKILERENDHEAAEKHQTKEKNIRSCSLTGVDLRMPDRSLRNKHYKKLHTCQIAMERSMLGLKKIEKVRKLQTGGP